jgi:hypothetical protein
MAVQTKLTWKRGKTAKDVTVSAGTTIAGSDAIEVNIDATKMSKKDIAAGLDEIKRYVLEHKSLV